jgi:hypothetical protein
MRCTYTVGLLYFLLHLSISILNNVAHFVSTADTVTKQTTLPAWLDNIRQQSWFRCYAQFAGLHGGYGFYSPSVSSSYHSVFTFSDAMDNKIHELADPGFSSLASKIRYRSLLEIQDGWIKDVLAVEKKINLFAEALGLSICHRVAMHYPGTKIQCRYFVRTVPALKAHHTNQEKHPIQHILLYDTSIKPCYETNEPSSHSSPRPSSAPERDRRVAIRRDAEAMA